MDLRITVYQIAKTCLMDGADTAVPMSRPYTFVILDFGGTAADLIGHYSCGDGYRRESVL